MKRRKDYKISRFPKVSFFQSTQQLSSLPHNLLRSFIPYNLISFFKALCFNFTIFTKSVTYAPFKPSKMNSLTKLVAAVAGCSAIVNGAVIPAENDLHTTTLQTRDTAKGTGHILSKREPVTIAILTAAGTAAVTAIVNEAVSAAAAFIGDISNFDAGREAFTVQTTETMMANNPDPERFQAAACYNKAFSVADPANIDGQSSVEFRLGILNTDYECMYIAAPNQFFTEGDGGLINVSHN
jgi:hypothetical protein